MTCVCCLQPTDRTVWAVCDGVDSLVCPTCGRHLTRPAIEVERRAA